MTSSKPDERVYAAGAVMRIFKEGTADLHKEVESYVPLLRADLTLVEYRDYLSRLLDFYAPLENTIRKHMPAYGDKLCLLQRLKSQWLVADVQAVEADLALATSSRCHRESRPLKSVEELIGALYVVEGATLGGKIILRALQQNLALPDHYCRFFHGYGPQTGHMWKTFCAGAESLTDTARVHEALASSITTFHEFIRCIHPSQGRAEPR